MGSRSRKRRRDPFGREGEAPAGTPAPAPARRVRGEARNELERAQLQPLAPGEVPRAVRVAAVLAVLIAAANVALWAAGWEIDGKRPKPFGVLSFAAVMVVAAWFLWRGRYWAVLGFQALLAIACVYSGLSLLLFENLAGLLVSLGVLVSSGLMFWFLIKAMARLQMPERPGARDS